MLQQKAFLIEKVFPFDHFNHFMVMGGKLLVVVLAVDG